MLGLDALPLLQSLLESLPRSQDLVLLVVEMDGCPIDLPLQVDYLVLRGVIQKKSYSSVREKLTLTVPASLSQTFSQRRSHGGGDAVAIGASSTAAADAAPLLTSPGREGDDKHRRKGTTLPLFEGIHRPRPRTHIIALECCKAKRCCC